MGLPKQGLPTPKSQPDPFAEKNEQEMSGNSRSGKAIWGKTQSQLLPLASVTMKFHGSQKAKEIRKGPAHWANASEARLRAQVQFHLQPRSKWEVQNKVPSQRCIFGKAIWWQVSALVLVAAALTMFCILMFLISTYMMRADIMYDMISHQQYLEKRVRDAIQQEAGNPALVCKSCKQNWLQWADNCYLGPREPMPWNECLDHCRSYGASLLIGKTTGEMQFLSFEARRWLASKSTLQIAEGYWMGLRYNLSQKSWNWADGSILHLKLPINEIQPPFSTNACVLFAKDGVVMDRCSSINYCLCKGIVS
ncbi:hypothetical protein JRQ81_015475 [Phrynocephalus forsythii]|uniref:C-type lectin domain-containing protein n=1 Tax=Phrynocephalus forsythii TaxID=171643 RepID=A0A9Q1B1G4_9SAUR|nr:hypothetical protein JRQ81_015475 [Phrynocephalus forsythii]